MIGSLYAGISGLNANSAAMTAIGDNIANVNTTAYKSNSVSFANMLSESLGGGTETSSIGRGVQLVGTVPYWSQGSIETTSNPTDLAINGRGFFLLHDSSGANYFTRAGAFSFDSGGTLKNSEGLTVQGYGLDLNGNIGSLTDISVPNQSTAPPAPTTQFTFDMNLDATKSAVSDIYTTNLSVYDSLGASIPVTLTFTNNGSAGSWTGSAAIPASAGTAATFSSNTFTFDGDGQLVLPASDITLSLALTNGATTPQVITWDLYDSAGNNNGDLTGYASNSTTTFQTQDGYASGVLRNVSVDEAGNVVGTYSNGQLIPLYKVAVYDFPNYFGLRKMGGNLYAETLASGGAIQGVAGQGSVGSISPSSLEMSNVDLASEFVKMITTQRAFQANSRVITTSDELLSELINLKR
jgi:flagellar hook protein FlgE